MTERIDSVPGPIGEGERLDSLDLLRGFAIFGILVVNIQFFAMPMMKAVLPFGIEDWPAGEAVVWAVTKAGFEYKFVSLFSLLFGAGLVMQALRSDRTGQPFAPRYFRRIVLLALFGLIHLVVFWYGDILLMYAGIGAILFLFRRLPPRTLLLIAAGLIVLAAIVGTTCAGLQVLGEAMQSQSAETVMVESAGEGVVDDAPTDADAEPHRGLDAMINAREPFDDTWNQGEILAYRDGPFTDAAIYRLGTFALVFIWGLFGFFWHIFAFFLVGAALMKINFFHPSNRKLQAKVAAAGLAIGLPLEIAVTFLTARQAGALGFDDIAAAFLHEFGAAALCLGYAGTGAWLAGTLPFRSLHAPVRAVGRMALTTYLGSTLIATWLMYWWGLGWFGEVSRTDQLLIVLVIFAALAVASAVWLWIFRFGPFEWLWRCATYGRAQPLLR